MTRFLFIFLVLQGTLLSAKTEEWVQKANLPASGRHGPIGFSIGNKGYVGMGHINSGAQGDVSFNDLWEYDSATNSWTQKADYPGTPFHYGVSFSFYNEGFIGYDFEFYKYSPATNSYTQLNTPPSGLYWNKTVVLTHKVIMEDNNTLLAYDPFTDYWSYYATNLNLFLISLIERDNHIYGLGVQNGLDQLLLAEFNPTENQWDSLSLYPDTLNKTHLCGFELKGDFYFSMGALNDQETGKACWKYDFDAQTWEHLEDFKGSGRRYYATFEIENKGYIFGGTNGTNMNNLWQLSPEDTATEKIIINPPPISFNNDHPYPNPSVDVIYFDLGDNPDELLHTVQLYNLNGKLVKSSTSTGAQLSIQKDDLASGMYYYKLTREGSPLKSGRIQFH